MLKREIHDIKGIKIAEIISDNYVINETTDGIQLTGSLYYEGVDSIILYEKNINPEFFDLKTGMAGEILQKFSTYRIRLAIVGDFSKYNTKSFDDFMYESNKIRHINFVDSVHAALEILSDKQN